MGRAQRRNQEEVRAQRRAQEEVRAQKEEEEEEASLGAACHQVMATTTAVVGGVRIARKTKRAAAPLRMTRGETGASAASPASLAMAARRTARRSVPCVIVGAKRGRSLCGY
jgi:hypothetical protein